MAARRGHYLKETMLRSQFETLEEPAPEAALVMDATLAPDDIIARILREIRLSGPRGDSSPQPA